MRLINIAFLLLFFNYCYSQTMRLASDTFTLDEDTLLGNGKSLDGHKIGYWKYHYKGGSFACRVYYLIDTNTVSLTAKDKQVLKRYQTSVFLDSILVSFEEFNEYYDSSHWVVFTVFQPIVLYNKEGRIVSQIIKEQEEYRSIYYQNSGLIESSTSIKNGFANGFEYIYNSNSQLQILRYYLNGSSQYTIRNKYDSDGNLLSSMVEYDQPYPSATEEIRKIWPLE